MTGELAPSAFLHLAPPHRRIGIQPPSPGRCMLALFERTKQVGMANERIRKPYRRSPRCTVCSGRRCSAPAGKVLSESCTASHLPPWRSSITG